MSQTAVQNVLLNLFKVRTLLRSSFYDFCFTHIISLLFLRITVQSHRPHQHMTASAAPEGADADVLRILC